MGVKVGIAGLGFMGTTHFAAYGDIPGAEVTAVCDLSSKKLAGNWLSVEKNIETGAAERADLSRIGTYQDFQEMLATAELDVVDVCVPTHLHSQFAVKALEAGRHVFTEKPMALNVEQCGRMIAAAEKAQRFLMVGMVLRFWPEYVMIKEMIDSRRYGRVRSCVMRRLCSKPGSPWYADAPLSGQAALDLHLHDADAIQWFFGRPSAVSARGVVEPDAGVRHIVTSYEFEDIPLVVAEGGWLSRPYPFFMSATVMFDSATVEFNSARKPSLTVCIERGIEEPKLPRKNAYAEELRYFVDCVSSGRPPERVTPADAASAVEIVCAEIELVKKGRPVELS